MDFSNRRNGNHNMTYQEIADELDISKETVKSQIKIALQKLRSFLKEYWEVLVLPILLNF